MNEDLVATRTMMLLLRGRGTVHISARGLVAHCGAVQNWTGREVVESGAELGGPVCGNCIRSAKSKGWLE